MRKKSKVTLTRNSHKVISQMANIATRRMYEATQEVRNETLKTLSGNRTGRQYRVPGTNVTYTASAPGEPPAVLFGQLRQNVKDKVYTESRSVKGEVGTELDKGLHLEVGTLHILPRPWLKPSFEKAAPNVQQILSRRWF